MDDSINVNDENKQKQAGQKRQQIESPFSAATPKSRLGKEPKRLFGQSKSNLADANLEETCVESGSRPASATPPDATLDSSNISYLDNVDPNLEQTQVYAAGTSANSPKDLSMVEESDETDADVTLADHFESKMTVEEDQTTPTASLTSTSSAFGESTGTPKGYSSFRAPSTRDALSPILPDDETPSAPTPLASRIERGLESVHTHSTGSICSPMHHPKSHIDYSLHEFEILEQKVEHEEYAKELQAKIDELREKHQQELLQINEARIFEEKMLMQQMEAATKKAKTEREEAKKREQSLELLVKELKAKMVEPDEQKQNLESQLAELNCRIEELTEKALRVDAMQQSTASYEVRIQQLETLESEARTQLGNARQEIESYQRLSMEMEEKMKTKIENAHGESTSSVDIEELKSEHEMVRTMMMEEVTRLENEVAKLHLQQPKEELDTLHNKIKKLESEAQISLERIAALEASIQSTEEIFATERLVAEEKLSEVKDEVEQLREGATNNARVSELEQELEELRQLMLTEVGTLEKQLETAHASSGGVNDALETAKAAIQELTTSLETNQRLLVEKENNIQELIASLDALNENKEAAETMKADLESSQIKIQELTSTLDNVQQQLDLAEKRSEGIDKANEELESSKLHIEQLSSSVEALKAELNVSRQNTNSSEADIDALQKEVDEVRLELDLSSEAATIKIKELESALEASSAIREQLTASEAEIKKLEESQADLEAIRQEISEKNELSEQLKTELDFSEKKIQELTATLELVQEESTTARNKIKDLEASQQATLAIQAQLEEAESKIQQLEATHADIESARQESVLNNEAKDQLQSDLDEERARSKELSATLDSLKTDLESAHQESEQAQAGMKQLEASLEDVQKTNDILRSEIESSSLKAQEFEAQLENVQQLTDSNEQILKKLEESDATIQELTSRVGLLTGELESTRQQETEAEAKLKENAAAQEVIQAELESVVQQKEELLQCKLSMEGKIRELTTSLESIQQASDRNNDQQVAELEGARQKAEQLELQISDLQQSLESKVAELAALINDSELKNSTIEVLQSQVSDLTGQLENTQTELTGAEQIYQSKMHELRVQIEDIQKTNESRVAELTAQIREVQQRDSGVDALQSQVTELTTQLENAQSELVGAEQIYQSKMQELRVQIEESQKRVAEQKVLIEEAQVKIERRETELVAQAVQHKEEVAVLQASLNEFNTSQKIDESRSEELNIRIEELQAAITFAQKALGEAEEAKKQKDLQLEQLHEQMTSLKREIDEERQSQQQKCNQLIGEVNEKLDAAEQSLSLKENRVVTLESQIEAMTQQFEARLEEANEWKKQAKTVESLNQIVALMQQQLNQLTEQKEEADRRCHEVEENAQHDITLIQGEKNEQSAALEEAKSEIAMLQEKLIKAEAEVDRLEKVCDDLDEDEKKWKAKIRELQAENKKLKGVKSPPKTLGLLQQARLNVQPLSRESSHVEPPSTEDGFEDAHDSFQSQTQQNPQKSFNETARGTDTSRLAAAGSTMLHPDDQAVEKTMVETPSKKNRSNCQQQ